MKHFNKLSNLKCIKIPKKKIQEEKEKEKRNISSCSISYTNIHIIKSKRRVKMMMVNGKKKMIDNN
jgi:ribosomal protein L34E